MGPAATIIMTSRTATKMILQRIVRLLDTWGLDVSMYNLKTWRHLSEHVGETLYRSQVMIRVQLVRRHCFNSVGVYEDMRSLGDDGRWIPIY